MSEPKFKVGDQVQLYLDSYVYTVVSVATIHTYALEWRDEHGALMRSFTGTPENKLSEPVAVKADYTDERLRAAISRAEHFHGGSMDPMEYPLDDARNLLAGAPTMLKGTRDELLKELTDSLEGYVKRRDTPYGRASRDMARGR